MQKKILKWLSASLLCFAISSCASGPPNKPLCVELTPWSGNCVNTVSGTQFTIDDNNKFEGKTWWEGRPYMIQMPASTWAAFKAYIIKMCKKTNMCDSEISTWERSIEIIDSQVEMKQ